MTVTAGRTESPGAPGRMVVQATFLNYNKPVCNSMANINYAKFKSAIEPPRGSKQNGLSKSSFSCIDLTQVGNYHGPPCATNDVCGHRTYSRNDHEVKSVSYLKQRRYQQRQDIPEKQHPQLHSSQSVGGGWVRAGLTLYPLTDVTETQLDSLVRPAPHRIARQTKSSSEIQLNHPLNHPPACQHGLPLTKPLPPRRSCSEQNGQSSDPEKDGVQKIAEYLAMSKLYYDQYKARENAEKQENQGLHGFYSPRHEPSSPHYHRNHPHPLPHPHVCESLSSSKSPLSSTSSSSLHRHPSLLRSKSETNLYSYRSVSDVTGDGSGSGGGVLSEDEDGDDYGFLSWPSNSLSSAMHKARSPLPSRRILPKRWRSKTKAISAVSSTLWSSEGSCTWCSMSGRRVTLRGTSLLQLSEKERMALQKIALSKLQALNLGCQICVPKETTQVKRGRRVLKMLKRKSHSANLSTLMDNLKENNDDKDRDCRPLGLVFGIPIAKCVANDLEIQRRRVSRADAIPLAPHHRKSSNSSVNSIDNVNYNGNLMRERGKEHNKSRAESTDSLSGSESGKYSSSLLDALSLSLSNQETPINLKTTAPQVPQVVKTCFKHLETYGLRTLGIFRVGSTKKRTKQMRDEFDCGKEVKLGEQHNPNDVAALLKEYFRDLPEPLLTRDLYSPLVATRNLYESGKQALAVRMLVALLPVPNRDTLWALLRFLNKVVEHSTDTIDENGHLLPGNKMDSHNLATLFGPNILHKAKTGGEKAFVVEDMNRAEERSEVIAVLEDMIDFYEDLFSVSADLQDELVRLLMETDPDAADLLLKQLASDYGIEPDPDTTCSSVFEDSDNSSLPHSPGVDMEMGLRARAVFDTRRNQSRTQPTGPHASLRQVQSLDPGQSQTTGADRLEVPQYIRSESDTVHADDSERAVASHSQKYPRSPRMPKLKVSHDKTSANVRGKTGHVGSADSYWVDPYTHDLLTVPCLDSRRKSSGSLTSQEQSPVGSESSGQWLMTTGSSSSANSSTNSPRIHYQDSPRPLTRESVSPRRQRHETSDGGTKSVSSSQQRPLSSRQRPLGVRNSEDSRSESSDLDYDRDRWPHWEQTAPSGDDFYEQETLV